MFKMNEARNIKRILRATVGIFMILFYFVGITVFGVAVISANTDYGWVFSLAGIWASLTITKMVLVKKHGSSNIYAIDDPKIARRVALDSAAFTALALTILFGWPGFLVGAFYGVLTLGTALWSKKLITAYCKIAMSKEDRDGLLGLIK